MPRIELSTALNTREDAVKIAHALWDEAVERSWERQYREILEIADLTNDIPTVGKASATFTVQVPVGEFGPVLGEALTQLEPAVYFTVLFEHAVEFDADPTGDCICEEDTRAIARKVLLHAKETVPALNNYRVSGHHVNGEFAAESGCSSLNCRH